MTKHVLVYQGVSYELPPTLAAARFVVTKTGRAALQTDPRADLFDSEDHSFSSCKDASCQVCGPRSAS